MEIGTQKHYLWLSWIVASVFALNIADGILTMYWVYSEKAVEWNPLLVRLVNEEPILFMLVKIFLVFLGSLLLWKLRKNSFAVVSIFLMFMVYYYLLLYHLSALNLRLLERLFA